MVTEVASQSAADALIAISIVDRIYWPNRSRADTLMAEQTTISIQVVDKASSVILGRNQLVFEKVTVIAETQRKGESKITKYQWDDEAVKVHLVTNRSKAEGFDEFLAYLCV